jgi:hypothetical protein
MQYSTEQLNKDIREINEKELEPIRIDRGKRYGDRDDTLANVAAFNWVGAAIPAYECAQRLKNAVNRLVEGTKPDNKEIENACHDLANYALYTLILWRRNYKEEK